MSIAPERLSIGINRHFTQPEVHPYDMVKWEKRDARISNWKDGSVAFEQRDVEFPDTWSLNATNIVSQKYFRGTPGTSEREVSLRQVIDRVADTIANWGIQGGYFVDEAEAEAFRNELKYILVTQRAAFNSPCGSTSASKACRNRRVPALFWPSKTRWTASSTGIAKKAPSSRVVRVQVSTCRRFVRVLNCSRAVAPHLVP